MTADRPKALVLLRGLRFRLVVGFALVAAVSALSTGALAFREARTGVLQQSQDTVVNQFRDSIDAEVPTTRLPPNQGELDVLVTDLARASGSQHWRVLATYRGLRAASSPGDPFDEVTPELRKSVETQPIAVFQRVRAAGSPVLVVGVPVAYGATASSGLGMSGLAVYLVVPQTTEQAYVKALIKAIERATVPALCLAVLLALLAARGVLRPVRALRGATRRMAAGQLDVRLAVSGSDELADLSRAFNDTAAALERSVTELRRMEAQARRFAADVSHELRTPLAAMSAVTDVLDEQAAALDGETADAVRLISEETVRLTQLVGDLMEISRFDAGVARLNLDEIDLAESVRRTLSARGWLHEVAAWLPEQGTLRARVDPRRLDVVVANLVGNALRHGAAPVTVRLAAAGGGGRLQGGGRENRVGDAWVGEERVGEDWVGGAWADDDWARDGCAVIEVLDSGAGIPEADLPHIFERFYKADASRGRSESSGLGLAITAENVHLHGGRIRAANRPGAGAVFTVELPLRRSPERERPPSLPPSEGAGHEGGQGGPGGPAMDKGARG